MSLITGTHLSLTGISSTSTQKKNPRLRSCSFVIFLIEFGGTLNHRLCLFRWRMSPTSLLAHVIWGMHASSCCRNSYGFLLHVGWEERMWFLFDRIIICAFFIWNANLRPLRPSSCFSAFPPRGRRHRSVFGGFLWIKLRKWKIGWSQGQTTDSINKSENKCGFHQLRGWQRLSAQMRGGGIQRMPCI